jgi:hypothetical protein
LAKRLIEFLRSVLPADPYQLLFLGGVVCLVTVHGVKWWPASAHASRDRVASSFGGFVLYAGASFLLPVLFATVAGYFICFWPGRHPIRRILVLVVFPAAITIILLLGRLLFLAGASSSILQNSGVAVIGNLKWLLVVAFTTLGFQVSLIGLLLILFFVLRLALGVSNLPLSLPSIRAGDSNEGSDWRPALMVTWFLIALATTIERIFLATAGLSFPALGGKHWFLAAALSASSIFAFAIGLLIAGAEARKIVRESIAVPKYKWTGFALVFPIAAEISLSVAGFKINALRITGVGSDTTFGDFAVAFLVLLLPAFFEEALFRGLLQKRFIRRYGLNRGIFLVCIAWAAFHFYSDFSMSAHDSYQQIFYRLSARVLTSLGGGFVLSWLTLKSGTVIPSTLAHALYNALIFSPPGYVFPWMSPLRTLLWAVAAIILFRFWPVPTEMGPPVIPPEDESPPSGPSQSGADPLPLTA